MAEETAESESPKKDVKLDAPDIEFQIQTAMRSRVAHFKEQAEYPLSLSLSLPPPQIGVNFESVLHTNLNFLLRRFYIRFNQYAFLGIDCFLERYLNLNFFLQFLCFGCSSLTFEGVRRLLEKDLGLEAYALDVQKRFIKQCLLKVLLLYYCLICTQHAMLLGVGIHYLVSTYMIFSQAGQKPWLFHMA